MDDRPCRVKHCKTLDPVTILSEKDISTMHNQSITILEKTGVKFEDSEARAILQGSGCKLGGDNRVFFPAHIVEYAIEKAPSTVTLYARNPEYDLVIPGSGTYFTNGFGAPSVFDLGTGQKRSATKEDLKSLIRLADALPMVHYCQVQVSPRDVPPEQADAITTAILFENTSKHVHCSTYDHRLIKQVGELGKIASGDRFPSFSLGCTTISPLIYRLDATQRLIYAARERIPFFIVSGACLGSTTPVTPASGLVVQNAEILAGITLSQLVSPGTPVVYGSFLGPMDMRSGKQLMGAPELIVLNAATTQLCREYGIPYGYGTGGVSDAAVPSITAAYEKALSVLFGVMAGTPVVHGAVSGLLDGATVVSYEQMLLDHEMSAFVQRLNNDIEIDEDSLAMDLIHSIGPGGSFLSTVHTVHHFRKTLFSSPLLTLERQPAEHIAAGMRDLAAARDRVVQILTEHSVQPLSDEQKSEMAKIINIFTNKGD
jgi:trimethylamine---corrinoid protein Co-methyltransferase